MAVMTYDFASKNISCHIRLQIESGISKMIITKTASLGSKTHIFWDLVLLGISD